MSRNGKHIFSHTMIYLLARGLPGMIAFAAIPLFTHLLSPENYGRYALVMATVNLLNALLFQWMRLSLVRYLPIYSDDTAKLKSTLACLNGALVLGIGIVAAAMYVMPLPSQWHAAILPCWLVMALTAAFELGCEYARATLRPWHYMIMQVMRSLVGVALGGLIMFLGAGWWGPLVGFGAGMTLAVAYAGLSDWRDVKLLIDRAMLKRLAMYGLPLSLTVALTIVIGSSDRFLIAHFLGESAAGLYSVAVDFTTQTLMLVMLTVYMAVFPLAVRAFEKEGVAVAQKHMKLNATALLAIGLPCTVGIAVLSPGVAQNFLGESYRAAAVHIMPLIAIGTFLSGFKACHFDAAFQFSHKTLVQVWIVLFAAIINVAFNVVAIPRWGINGSAIASVGAYVISIGLTVIVGRRFFALPFPFVAAAQTVVAATLMGGMLWVFRVHVSRLAFVAQVSSGMCVYGGALTLMNFMDLRTKVSRRLSRNTEREMTSVVVVEAEMASVA